MPQSTPAGAKIINVLVAVANNRSRRHRLTTLQDKANVPADGREIAGVRKTFSFTCSACGKLHEGSPGIAFEAPANWRDTFARSDPENSTLDSDFCMIERRDYFIRCILEIPIIGVDEPFTLGVWLSQSKANFDKYVETFPDSPAEITLGFFSNALPRYPDTLRLKSRAHWRPGKLRPWVELEPCEHPLHADLSKGISWERAIEIATQAQHRRTEQN